MTTYIIFILYFCVSHLTLLGMLYLNKPVEPVLFNTLLARCYLWPTLFVSALHGFLVAKLSGLFDRFTVAKDWLREQVVEAYDILHR